jgi:hypothetical protein
MGVMVLRMAISLSIATCKIKQTTLLPKPQLPLVTSHLLLVLQTILFHKLRQRKSPRSLEAS